MGGVRRLARALGRVPHEAVNVAILARAGVVVPMRPDRAARLALAGARWGASPATPVLLGAIRHPGRAMVVDDLGALTYGEVDRRSNALARGLARAGVTAGDRVGLLCRDHRWFVEATTAVAKLGADVLLLNTSFAAPQLAAVCAREQPAALIFDEEFAALLAVAGEGRPRFVAWQDTPDPGDPSLASLVADGDTAPLDPSDRTGRVTILTSGTTGPPKGASRGAGGVTTLDPPAALLERIPLREGQVMAIAAPLFHAWGFSGYLLGTALGMTLVLRRRFDPETLLADVATHGCAALVVVPVMLQRVLDLPEPVRGAFDTSALRAVCASGSALPGDLAAHWMDAFGDHLFNMYGSTEVAIATLATPADLRAAPGTAGRPARGCVVRLYDELGLPVAPGATGRVFVGNAMLFEGYTGGGGKEILDGLVATGDVGRFDGEGRLFVQGRDDEMIVSGGNVFPKEVEDLLATHPAVLEAAAVGVDDDRFGRRLRAFVVLAAGARASEAELQEFVRDNLARFKVPREVVFLDEALPRNPAGKVVKRELAVE